MPGTPEERKKAWEKIVKDDLHNALVRIIESDESPRITMGRVAEAAGVSKGTLYNYFRNKDELISYSVNHIMEPIFEKLESFTSSGETAEKILDKYIEITLSWINTHQRFFQTVIEPSVMLSETVFKDSMERRKRLHRLLCSVVEKGINEGSFRKVNVPKAANLILSGIMGHNMLRLFSGDTSPIESDISEFIAIIKGGIISTVPGEK